MTPLNLKLPKPKLATPVARPHTAVELAPEGALAATLPGAGAGRSTPSRHCRWAL